MNFLSEYGDLISILLAIVLAVFFYKKVAAIHYVYYSKETLFAIWNLVKGIVKTRDIASLKNALEAFVNDLPYVGTCVKVAHTLHAVLRRLRGVRAVGAGGRTVLRGETPPRRVVTAHALNNAGQQLEGCPCARRVELRARDD